MKLLVLGGTVFLSREIARRGAARGHEVTAAARGVSGEPPEDVRFVPVDRDADGGLSALAGESFDAVVDVARLPRHVGGAIDALVSQTAHWIFVSTCSVYADDSTPGQTAAGAPLLEPTAPESADLDPELYGRNKVACERLVRKLVGDRALVIRAGLIVGPGDPNDRFGYWPRRIADGGEVLAPGAPDEDVQYIDVGDLAEWIIDSAERGRTGTYDGAGPPMSRRSFLEEIAAAVGSRPSFTWVPQEFLLSHGVQPWAGEESLGLWLPLPEYGGFMSRDVSASLAAGLRLRPLAATALDWLAQPGERPAPLASLSREKEAAVLSAWRAREG